MYGYEENTHMCTYPHREIEKLSSPLFLYSVAQTQMINMPSSNLNVFKAQTAPRQMKMLEDRAVNDFSTLPSGSLHHTSVCLTIGGCRQ